MATGLGMLLIVPYGIEILKVRLQNASWKLLIVPYGIEMTYREDVVLTGGGLLIVPYGIEIYGDNVEEWDKENF